MRWLKNGFPKKIGTGFLVLPVCRLVRLGQNQMCSRKLSGCGWLKLNKKKCAVGKIKNTEG